MNEIGQLRIYVEENYFPVYQAISGGNLFKQNSEFFILCTFIGEMNEQRKPVNKKYELCRAITLTGYDKTAIKALYLKHHNHLSSTKIMIEYAERYANGGFEWIAKEVLFDFLIKNHEGKWRLKDNCEDEIQLALTKYLLSKKQKIPF